MSPLGSLSACASTGRHRKSAVRATQAEWKDVGRFSEEQIYYTTQKPLVFSPLFANSWQLLNRANISHVSNFGTGSPQTLAADEKWSIEDSLSMPRKLSAALLKRPAFSISPAEDDRHSTTHQGSWALRASSSGDWLAVAGTPSSSTFFARFGAPLPMIVPGFWLTSIPKQMAQGNIHWLQFEMLIMPILRINQNPTSRPVLPAAVTTRSLLPILGKGQPFSKWNKFRAGVSRYVSRLASQKLI